ncbi:TetR/AcrR family transcriptional regulator [Cryptosporangium sp. NPDC048952]|uniref:TetR/AcrR family transcriptional regulator n=1 Tax=Cryptosporangium sp. NPDC048952 TaxID=3363961 RepID=UPI003722600C
MKLTRDRIVDAGMQAFAERGYAGMSMRQLAETLDVHAGSLYYHVKNKEQLLALLAERVADEAYTAGTAALAQLPADAPWPDKIEAQLTALRASLLARTGAPALLAASPALLSDASLGLMERLQETLVDAGIAPAERGMAADTLMSYVTGFVLQEQTDAFPRGLADEARIAELAGRYPLTFSGRGPNPDAMFQRSLRMLCGGIATLVGAPA